MNRELNKLAKKVDQFYWKNGQHLIVDTWEVMEGGERDCCFDVILYNKEDDIFLFTIQNYNIFKDFDLINKSYFKDKKWRPIYTWDGVRVSCTPLYLDRVITLKTFKPITKQDIVNATNYFVHEILGIRCWNIKFNEEVKDSKQLEFKF